VSNGGGRQVSLGRIAGIPVRVSPTWFLVAAVLTVGFAPIVERQLPESGPAKYAIALTFALLLYASVLFHEISHALTARALGLPVRGITLHFLGGYTEIGRDSPTPGRDLVVAAAGPVVSLVAAGLAFLVSQPVDQPVAEFLLLELAVANLLVGIFNLLPALPLDGGHMLRAAVWRVTGKEHVGTVVAARAGQVLAGLVLVLPFVLGGTGGRAVVEWSHAGVGRRTVAEPVTPPRSRADDPTGCTDRPGRPSRGGIAPGTGQRCARLGGRRFLRTADRPGQRGLGRRDPG
jgi:Zn-dependent protease